MHDVEVKRHLGDGDIAAVSELLEVAARADGHRPVDDHQWLDVVEGRRQGFAGLVARERDGERPVGYAQVTRGRTSWALEFVVHPGHRNAGSTVADDLVHAAVGVIRDEGGGRVHLWVPKPNADHDRIAGAVGLRRGRELYQMRTPLPLGESSSLPTRPFEVGRDEEAWLEVNNRAFAWHPEQSGWDLETLKSREAEPWFDPEGFLLHERDGRLAGFCWTKVHVDHEPPLGEIYVIGVDPDFQGEGLGRRLVVAGLETLATRGLDEAMLYVDASNRPAVSLYEKLGFTVDHVDRAYVGDV